MAECCVPALRIEECLAATDGVGTTAAAPAVRTFIVDTTPAPAPVPVAPPALKPAAGTVRAPCRATTTARRAATGSADPGRHRLVQTSPICIEAVCGRGVRVQNTSTFTVRARPRRDGSSSRAPRSASSRFSLGTTAWAT